MTYYEDFEKQQQAEARKQVIIEKIKVQRKKIKTNLVIFFAVFGGLYTLGGLIPTLVLNKEDATFIGFYVFIGIGVVFLVIALLIGIFYRWDKAVDLDKFRDNSSRRRAQNMNYHFIEMDMLSSEIKDLEAEIQSLKDEIKNLKNK